MSWINTITKSISSLMNLLRKPTPPLPLPLLLCEVIHKPGLSAMALTASLLKRMEDAGIPTGPNPDGSPNLNNELAKIFAEEFIKEFKLHARVDLGLPPSTLSITATGGNVGGPIIVQGTNTLPSMIFGSVV